MNICLVNLDYAPERTSGLAVYGEMLAEGLHAIGHQVTVIASDYGGGRPRDDVGGVQLVRVPIGATNWIGFSYRAARQLDGLQRAARFDVVHFLDLHFAYAYCGDYVATLVQPFGLRLQAKGRLPYSHSLPNLAFRYAYYALASLTLERRAAARARKLLATCHAVRDAFLRQHPAVGERTIVVPLGVDTARYHRQDASGLRDRLGLVGKQVLLYAGFSTPRKGLEYLGQALDGLGPHVRLLIVGKWERGYRERFHRSLSASSAPRVIEVGYIPDEEMPLYYSLADVFVLPSLLEGFGLTLAEAMACGAPIVATNVGSIPEVVGEGGLLVPAKDPKSLAKAVEALLVNEEQRRTLAALGRERVLALYTKERMVRQTLEAYCSP